MSSQCLCGFSPVFPECIRLIGVPELLLGVNVCVHKCCDGLVTCPGCIPAPLPVMSGMGSSPPVTPEIDSFQYTSHQSEDK